MPVRDARRPVCGALPGDGRRPPPRRALPPTHRARARTTRDPPRVQRGSRRHRRAPEAARGVHSVRCVGERDGRDGARRVRSRAPILARQDPRHSVPARAPRAEAGAAPDGEGGERQARARDDRETTRAARGARRRARGGAGEKEKRVRGGDGAAPRRAADAAAEPARDCRGVGRDQAARVHEVRGGARDQRGLGGAHGRARGASGDGRRRSRGVRRGNHAPLRGRRAMSDG